MVVGRSTKDKSPRPCAPSFAPAPVWSIDGAKRGVRLDIRFEEAGVRYGAHQALAPLSLRLTERRIGVIGLNGSGKTSFIRLINGLVKPSTGTVTVNGRPAGEGKPAAMVFQNPANQIILPIVGEDIAFGLSRSGLAAAEIEARVDAVLARFGISHLKTRRAHELSGGELQLAALSAVMVTAPEILILDEPTNQLDLRNRARVASTIDALDLPVITVSHNLPLIEAYDRVLLFHDGALLGDGTPEAVMATYRAVALA